MVENTYGEEERREEMEGRITDGWGPASLGQVVQGRGEFNKIAFFFYFCQGIC